MCALLAQRPSELVASGQRLSWGLKIERQAAGSPDVVPFFEAIVEGTHAEGYLDGVDRIHKVLRSRHLPLLLPLLEKGSAAAFDRLLWNFSECAKFDREDRYRAAAARGLLYSLARLRAEREGRPIPKLVDVACDLNAPAGGGLSPAFRTLAAAFDPEAESGFTMGAEGRHPLTHEPPRAWLERWALTLSPAAVDLPTLHLLLKPYKRNDPEKPAYGGLNPSIVRWAFSAMARLPGPEGREQIEAWAPARDERALHAAVALAGPGGRDRARALHQAGVRADCLEWVVDRDRARREAAIKILAAWPPRVPAEDAGLGPRARLEKELYYSVSITQEDLDWIEDELWRADALTLTLFWWHAHVRQGRISDRRVALLLERLKALGALDWKAVRFDEMTPFLATLELRRPVAFRALLHTWMETQPGCRAELLMLLARLGDTRHVDAMLPGWTEWNEWSGWTLGRVKDPRVHAFLVQQAVGDDYADAMCALQALLVEAGLPVELRGVFSVYSDLAFDEAPLSTARTLMLAGEALEAVLHMLAWAGQSTSPYALGLVDDERARELLRTYQRERERGFYWQAPIGLALGGDLGARAELQRFLEDDRPWLLMDLPEGILSHLEPSLAEHWIERLDSNCCLAYEAMVQLRAAYPTIPYDDGYGGAGTRFTRAWHASTTWRRSPLLEGLVPLGR